MNRQEMRRAGLLGIYHVTRTDKCNHNDYTEFVIICESEEEAKKCCPGNDSKKSDTNPFYNSGADEKNIEVKLIGYSDEKKSRVVLFIISMDKSDG